MTLGEFRTKTKDLDDKTILMINSCYGDDVELDEDEVTVENRYFDKDGDVVDDPEEELEEIKSDIEYCIEQMLSNSEKKHLGELKAYIQDKQSRTELIDGAVIHDYYALSSREKYNEEMLIELTKDLQEAKSSLNLTQKKVIIFDA